MSGVIIKSYAVFSFCASILILCSMFVPSMGSVVASYWNLSSFSAYLGGFVLAALAIKYPDKANIFVCFIVFVLCMQIVFESFEIGALASRLKLLNANDEMYLSFPRRSLLSVAVPVLWVAAFNFLHLPGQSFFRGGMLDKPV